MSFLSIHLLKEDTVMNKSEIEQKIRDLKTKLSCQESDIGDWKIAKCIEYSTLVLFLLDGFWQMQLELYII